MKTKRFIWPVVIRENLLRFSLVLFLVMPGLTVHSQESSGLSKALYPSFGFGIGFFYPGDVNEFIQEEMNSLGYIEEFNTEMYMYFEIRGGLTYRIKNLDFSGLLEYDLAPKWIMVSGGDDLNYYYSRIGPMIMINYYIPVGSGKHAFFVGGGINYSFMKFEEFSASNPGFKLQAGYNLQFGTFNLQPFGAFTYAKATDSSDPFWDDFGLNYTSGQIGVNMSFHPVINYK